MTTGRRPAGAPEEEPRPAGMPPATEAERPDGNRAADTVVNESAAQVGADLDALLEDVKRERDEYLALAQRARADFENYRKRVAGEALSAERRGKTSIARDMPT